MPKFIGIGLPGWAKSDGAIILYALEGHMKDNRARLVEVILAKARQRLSSEQVLEPVLKACCF